MNAQTSLPAAGVARSATAREFLAVVFRRKWIIIGLFVVASVTVLSVAFTTRTSYQSFGEVLIKRGEQESLLQPNRRMSGWEEELASEIEVVRSAPVQMRAQQLLDQQASEGLPRIDLGSGSVGAEVKGESNVILIGYVHSDPKIAERACNAVVTAYVEHRLKTLNLAYPKEFFDAEVKKVTEDLDRYETLRRNFARGSDAYAIEDQTRNLVSSLLSMRQRRTEIDADLRSARSNLEQIEKFASQPDLDSPTMGQGANEQVLVDLKLRVLGQETRLAQLRERYREDSPEIVNGVATLETLRGFLQREVQSRVEVSRGQVRSVESRLKPLDDEIARVETSLASMPSKEMTLSEIDREVGVLKDRYRDLVNRSDQARITEQTTPMINVLVLHPPGPARPTNARDYVRLALAPAFSLLVGIGLAFFADGLDPRVRTPGDLESTLQLPVLASVTERRRRRGTGSHSARQAVAS
ncbi:MAG: hypothetical protein HOP12_08710 [Candidatus Eisenbacteria bacterium]|uniref:Polysaccharide chain length determinant N-terminal domain-containing protein n=1 Tax=Eiseniibacteriota bacterium TaxID=2212470 RepID=A0A849SNQ1_UNCEI|nr:hypothetical protein [Candidatus Eisenbacteria bacterium]